MKDYKMSVEGMHCENCSSRVTKALTALEGTVSVDVNLEAKCVFVRTDQPASKLKEAVENLGFDVYDIVEDNVNC